MTKKVEIAQLDSRFYQMRQRRQNQVAPSKATVAQIRENCVSWENGEFVIGHSEIGFRRHQRAKTVTPCAGKTDSLHNITSVGWSSSQPAHHAHLHAPDHPMPSCSEELPEIHIPVEGDT